MRISSGEKCCSLRDQWEGGGFWWGGVQAWCRCFITLRVCSGGELGAVVACGGAHCKNGAIMSQEFETTRFQLFCKLTGTGGKISDYVKEVEAEATLQRDIASGEKEVRSSANMCGAL